MALHLVRVPWLDPRAIQLRNAMDDEMGVLYADLTAGATDDENERVARALAVDDGDILTSILVLDGDGERVVGHTALRPYGDALEVKKVFVTPEYRGRGLSKLLMAEAETIARAEGVTSLVLQTGNRQPEAIALYLAVGYREIPVFPPYDVMDISVCFGKDLIQSTPLVE
ncbi:MAG TPA: GNAT family N-acetyltransferase [Galbitalea sp.]|jgi:GNAT superfamily N-acetyltransferase